MLFKYKATTPEGKIKEGQLEAPTSEIAVNALQKRNLIVVSLESAIKESFFEKDIFSFERVKRRDVVVLSRKISTLFEAKVPVLSALKLLSSEIEKKILRRTLSEITGDIEGGAKISQAMSRHPKVFSKFYINMVRAGEESGKLDEVFSYLADYLERSHELTSKALRALIYPAFVILAFVGVMVLMLTVVVPKLGEIVKESGQEIPFYTQVVFATSDFMRSYGIFILLFFLGGVFLLWRYWRTKVGAQNIAKFQLSVPLFGSLYQKIYLSQISDTLETLIAGGVSMLRSLEITLDVVDNQVYKSILEEASEAIRGGSGIADSLAGHKEITPLFSQMVKIGEQTGKLGFILKTLARYYRKEVEETVAVLISLIEPAMIIVLGAGVGLLMASILVPIYNMALAV